MLRDLQRDALHDRMQLFQLFPPPPLPSTLPKNSVIILLAYRADVFLRTSRSSFLPSPPLSSTSRVRPNLAILAKFRGNENDLGAGGADEPKKKRKEKKKKKIPTLAFAASEFASRLSDTEKEMKIGVVSHTHGFQYLSSWLFFFSGKDDGESRGEGHEDGRRLLFLLLRNPPGRLRLIRRSRARTTSSR